MDAEKRLNDLIAITTRLINVLERENEMLREHRHSDIHSILDEKATIGRVYESRVIGLSENPGALAEGPPELREQLAELAHKVDRLMADNSVMLKISVDVSRRVVNLIAEAVKETAPTAGTYSARGKKTEAAPAGGNMSLSLNETL